MIKKKINLIISVCIFMLMFATNVQAEDFSNNVTQSENARQEMELLPLGTTNSKDVLNSVERSSIIAAASSEIIDETGGDIGVIIETLCHVECNEIRNIAILDRLNEEEDTWEEVARYDFTAVKDDFPTQTLSSLTNSFTIENQSTGYYYRIRGIHSVSTTDGKGQTYVTRTDGLLITDYGR